MNRFCFLIYSLLLGVLLVFAHPIDRPYVFITGGTIENIAMAKAGIMKAGRPVILGRQPEIDAEAVLLHQGRVFFQKCKVYLNVCLRIT